MFKKLFDSILFVAEHGAKYLSIYLIVAASMVLTIGSMGYYVFRQAYPVMITIIKRVNDTDEATKRIEEQLKMINAVQQINSHQIQQANLQASKNHRDIIFTVKYWNRLTQQEIIQEIDNNIYMPQSKISDSITPIIGVRKLK